MRLLETAATGHGVQLLLLTDKAAVERVLEFVVQGNTATCWLDEIAGSRVTSTMVGTMSGSFGLSTYSQPAGFAYLRAYALQP